MLEEAKASLNSVPARNAGAVKARDRPSSSVAPARASRRVLNLAFHLLYVLYIYITSLTTNTQYDGFLGKQMRTNGPTRR